MNNIGNLRRRKQREESFTFGTWVTDEIGTITDCLESSNNISQSSPVRAFQAWPDCKILGLVAGIYSLQLEHWLRHFLPHQFIMVLFEEIYQIRPGYGTKASLSHHRLVLEEILSFVDPALSSLLRSAQDLSHQSQKSSFSFLGHDAASDDDLRELSFFFGPFNVHLCELIDRFSIRIAPHGVSSRRILALWKM
jgi:hypothetical protein